MILTASFAVEYGLYKDGNKIGTQVVVGPTQYLKRDGEAITTFGFTGPYFDLDGNYVEYGNAVTVKMVRERSGEYPFDEEKL